MTRLLGKHARLAWIVIGIIGWAILGIWALTSGSASLIMTAALLIPARLFAWQSTWPDGSLNQWVASVQQGIA